MRRPCQWWWWSGGGGLRCKDWEIHHLALLTTTFKPDIMRRVREVKKKKKKKNDGGGDGGDLLSRTWRRSYGKILMSNPAAEAAELKVSGVPASWKNGGEATEEVKDQQGGDGKLVLRYKDEVVDEIPLRKGG